MNPFEKDEFGLTVYKDRPIVSSIAVAEKFDKNHNDLMKSIRELIRGLGEISQSDWKNNFWESTYKNVQNKVQPCYNMTFKGFTLLAVGFTGKKALRFKVLYINRFEEMEAYINTLKELKGEHPDFTRNVMAIHAEPKYFHFANEYDLINRIALGVSAKQYKLEHGIDLKVNSIRPYLTLTELKAVNELIKFDTGLLLTHSFNEHKGLLNKYYQQLQDRKLLAV